MNAEDISAGYSIMQIMWGPERQLLTIICQQVADQVCQRLRALSTSCVAQYMDPPNALALQKDTTKVPYQVGCVRSVALTNFFFKAQHYCETGRVVMRCPAELLLCPAAS